MAEASDFAGRVEELSRAVGYLQLVAAAAVDRSRKRANSTGLQASAVGFGADAGGAASGGASDGWLTGWNTEETATGTGKPAFVPATATATARATATATATATARATATATATATALAQAACAVPELPPGNPIVAVSESGCLDDGFRNTMEFLRARLRISAAEARRRLSLAADLLPRTGIGGRPLPAAKEELAAAVADGTVASHAASIITLALDRVRGVCPPESAARMEHALTLTALENDHDFLSRIARRWTEALDQDGAEPSQAELRRLQGAFVRRPRRGLQHLEIYATTEQFEYLLSVMNIATNPRISAAGGDTGSFAAGHNDPHACRANQDAVTAVARAARAARAAGAADASEHPANPDSPEATAEAHHLDQRSRPQRLLDGLIGACKAALASGKLPSAGGLRPQVMVTIDYRDLLERLGGPGNRVGDRGPGSGSLMFTGPVTASTVRKIACDADIIPVLLGGSGRILDVGRASRIFPPHIRKAITARDRGCAFPQCTIPAPWCEAHHITYWSHGGTTGTDNAALLCSHHHHLVHKEQWSIEIRTGVPWFLPPPHVDPRLAPRRNNYFRLD
ncbi:HNH endonuclease signature motif containing protein [Arthrobacter sp. PAMC25284]|uniref:HNH endonuclease signature motif containing protein n=1 Tax=Arthrobacter sp. PAMC25284 TaxID=2861279 RepID=UPI0021597CB2|nr:HNH endonuclease signature motif containing protein [Arthrobacter sp. PAMC25284]